MLIAHHAPTLTAVLLMAAAPDKAPNPERAFVAQAKKTAATAKLEVTALWRGDLDGDPATTEYVALLCAPSSGDNASGGEPEVFLIFQDASHAWVAQVARNSGSECGGPSEAGKWQKLMGTFELSDGYHSWDASMKVAIRESRLVHMASKSESHSMDTWWSSSEDWEALTFSSGTGGIGSGRESRAVGAVVLVLDQPDAKLPPTWNEPVSGKDKWTDKADASLTVRAIAKGDAVELSLTTADDARLPVPAGADAKAFLAADHLELWWTAPREQPCKPDEPKTCTLRHLGIGAREDGSWDVRWLEPASEPLPAVTGKPEALSVTVPVAQLAKREGSDDAWQTQFSAVYSDSDAAGAGQQTLVATSRLKWGKPGTLGQLVRLKGGVRYPAATSSSGGLDAQLAPWKPGGPLPQPE